MLRNFYLTKRELFLYLNRNQEELLGSIRFSLKMGKLCFYQGQNLWLQTGMEEKIYKFVWVSKILEILLLN